MKTKKYLFHQNKRWDVKDKNVESLLISKEVLFLSVKMLDFTSLHLVLVSTSYQTHGECKECREQKQS